MLILSNNDAGLIIVGMTKNQASYYIISRNKIDETARTIIEEHLGAVEGMDKEQLRKLYREKRKKQDAEDSQGAGIGFIEIARRSDKIEHHYQPDGDRKALLHR